MSEDGELEKELTEIAEKLICFRSTADRPKQIKKSIDFVEEYLSSSTSVIVKRGEFGDNPYIIATFEETKKPKIFLCGHLDVVEASDDEFKPKVEQGKLYGRGAIDMKGNCAAMILAMKKLANEKNPPSIGLMLTTDEESGGRHTVDYLLVDKGYSCEMAIVPDGGYNFQLVTAEKGAIWLKITVKGKAGHGSRPWTGINAIEKAFEEFSKIKTLFPEIKDESQWAATINLGKIVGGDAINKIPVRADLFLDIRYTEDKGYEQTISEIKQKSDGKIEIQKHSPILNTPGDNPHIIAYKNTAEEILGRKIPITKSAGGSDAKFFGRKNIPVIEICPQGGNHHGKDEWIQLNSLSQFYQILYAFCLNHMF